MKIKDLKEDHLLIYEAAVSQLEEGETEESHIGGAFTWNETNEGGDFWCHIDDEEFDEAYEICPHLKPVKTGGVPNYIKGIGTPPLLTEEKPTQYQIGIDTFERMKSNCTKEEIIGFCKGNVDKYIHRKKGTDKEDLVKAKDYIDLWLWVLENK